MNKGKMKHVALAACVAATFALAAPVTAFADDQGSVACYGVNSCKGTGSCKTANNSCKGQNACKGQGVTMMNSADDCTNAGGTTSSN